LWSFNFADYEFVKRGSSAADIDQALENWAGRSMHESGIDSSPFRDHKDMLRAIDAIKVGEASWSSFDAGYTGNPDDMSAGFLRDRWTVHTRDIREVAHLMMANPEYNGHFDYTARREFVPTPGQPDTWERRFSDVMSGDWAWNESVGSHGSSVILWTKLPAGPDIATSRDSGMYACGRHVWSRQNYGLCRHR
jgi:hypothetical protein